MLKAGTVEEYLAGRHQAHGRGQLERGRPGRGGPQDAAGGQQAGQRADPRDHRHGRARAGQGRGEGRGPDRQDPPAGRAAPGRDPAGEGVHRREAEDLGGRQDGRTPRQQGHRGPHRARGGHAVPAGRLAGGHRAQPAGRAEPDERRADPGDPPRVVRAAPGFEAKTPVFRGADEGEIGLLLRLGGLGLGGQRSPSSVMPPVVAPADISRLVATT